MGFMIVGVSWRMTFSLHFVQLVLFFGSKIITTGAYPLGVMLALCTADKDDKVLYWTKTENLSNSGMEYDAAGFPHIFVLISVLVNAVDRFYFSYVELVWCMMH